MTTPHEGALIRLSAALAARDRGALASAMQEACEEVDPVAVEEALLQSYLFVGFPACLNAFALWRRISDHPADPPVPVDIEGWRERGREVLERVYAGQFERLRENIRGLHGDMDLWMQIEGYGKVLGRPGLSLDVRELCIVAMLAVLSEAKQLYSHLRGALNVGASRERIERALEAAEAFGDEESVRQARRTWHKVLQRREGRKTPVAEE